MAVYGYTRVSLNIQVDNGESLGVQERQISGYAQMNGWEVKQTFVEKGVSGSIPLGDRPTGKKLLNSLVLRLNFYINNILYKIIYKI